AADIEPMVTYGTNPGMGIKITEVIPEKLSSTKSDSFDKALKYMGLMPGNPIKGLIIQNVFIGSCTNSRIEDLRIAADFVKGKKVPPHIRAMIVPGSQRVRKQAKEEGLNQIFESAGFEFREAG